MKITNRFNLPGPLVNAIKGFDKAYQKTRGETRLSVTQLINPPLVRKLKEEHFDEIEEDASDRIWSLFGSAVHSVLEKAGGMNDLTEERLFTEVNGIKVSGQGDLYEANGTLSDYKITSVWAVIRGHKKEWEQQLNLLAYLYAEAGFPPQKLQIVAILRDWSKNKAIADANYPQCNVKVIDIPLWNKESQEEYLNKRVKEHQSEELVECTDAEKWHKQDVYAIMREGRKSAIKLCDTKAQAEERKFQEVGKGKGKVSIVLRPGKDIRCDDYCPVRKWCPFK